MLSELQIHLDALPHPDPCSLESQLEAWGKIVIHIRHDSEYKKLLEWQWDIIGICNWYLENIGSIFEITLPDIQENESIAEALERMNNCDFEDDKDDEEFNWFSMLHEFRRHHSLRFALRGAPIPDIIIGRNQGYGEVSFSQKGRKWAYSFDIEKFRRGIQEEFSRFLAQWYTVTSSSESKKISLRLLEELKAI